MKISEMRKTARGERDTPSNKGNIEVHGTQALASMYSTQINMVCLGFGIFLVNGQKSER